MTEMSGQRVFLTGAGGGIGRGLALSLARRGAIVGITDVSQRSLDEISSELGDAGFKCWCRTLDVTKVSDVAETVGEFSAAHEGIDLVVNNAGLLSVANVVDLDIGAWQRVMDVNANGTFLVSQAVIRDMMARGREGSVICISSISGKVGDPGLAHYSASKFAVRGFVQSLAREVAQYGITVNAICPGIVDTPMVRALARDSKCGIEDFLQLQLIKRPQTPEEIAMAVAFLHTCRAVTGQSISVDGGSFFH
jgi:meso-butanediol dehydrogenase/(S,S)-butanediol dehydrogenase/diacetyl reductase